MTQLIKLSLSAQRAFATAVGLPIPDQFSDRFDQGYDSVPTITRDELVVLFEDKLR